MNANFDEMQAFENLHDILNHIKNFANYYYDEMQKAQSACKDKDSRITALNRQLADERDRAETRLEKAIQAKDREIDALKGDLANQTEVFNEQLAKSRESNEKLTNLLKNVYADLQEKKDALKWREETLKDREDQLHKDSDTLATASANLDEERRDFYALREIQETTPSDAERIRNLEKEAGELTRQKNELEKQLANTAQKLKEVQDENEKLKIIVDNANAERKGMNSAAKHTAEFDGDLDVAPMKNNFDNAPAENDAENFNDKPADNPSEEKWRDKFV